VTVHGIGGTPLEGWVPFAPAWEQGRIRWLDERTNPYEPWSIKRMAKIVGVNERTITRWNGRGQINADYADLVAVRLGTHPGLLWPEFWWAECA